MSEFPSRTCGQCHNKDDYAKAAATEGDYLVENRIPNPNLVHTGKMDTKHEHAKLGIPHNPHEIDLKAPVLAPQQQPEPPLGFADLPPVPAKKDLNQCCCASAPTVSPVDNCQKNPYSLQRYENPCLNAPSNFSPKQQEVEKEFEKAEKPLKSILKSSPPAENTGIKVCPCEAVKSQEQKQKKPENFWNANLDSAKDNGKNNEQQNVLENKGECYLPRPEDTFPAATDGSDKLGPWATGRVDWGPLAGLTGVRPVVDKYSVSRFSESEWRAHNKSTLESISDASHRANMMDYNSKAAIEHSCRSADENQEDSTKRLQQREREIHRWKCELERSITASDEELTKVLAERQRLKHALSVLQMPESIVGECLDRRTSRLDPELVRDEVEEELIREMALIAEIREQFTRALADVEHQLLENKTAKQRLENDWSDKKETNEWEAINVALNNRSTMLMFKPGAVGFPDNQSTLDYWEKFTRETLEESEVTRQRSVALRGTLVSISLDAAKNLRAQADKVELALAKRISCMEDIRVRLENELRKNLKQLADLEATMINLRDAIRRLDVPMKKAQTRLDNRSLYRPRVENCRDPAHYGIIEEVKSIGDGVTALRSQLKQAEIVQSDLVIVRGKLEREIFIKRKTLEIDRDRLQKIRAYYPSMEAMQGY